MKRKPDNVTKAVICVIVASLLCLVGVAIMLKVLTFRAGNSNPGGEILLPFALPGLFFFVKALIKDFKEDRKLAKKEKLEKKNYITED